MSAVALDLAPLQAARSEGFGLEIYVLPVPGDQDGWRAASAAAEDAELMELLLKRTRAAAGTSHPAVAATWHLEKHAWWVAALLVGSTTTYRSIPPLGGLRVRDGEHGWVEALGVPADGWESASGNLIAERIERHLEPLVDALAHHRSARVLWSCAADRLAQAAIWCERAFGDAETIRLAREALAEPTSLMAPANFERTAAGFARRRRACCLAHRATPSVRCSDCPLRR